MRVKGLLLAVVASLLFIPVLGAQEKGKPDISAAEAHKIDAAPRPLPSYFPPGIQKETDPLKQRAAMMRMYIATQQCTQSTQENSGFNHFIPSPDSISIQTNVTSTSSVTENPASMKIVLDNYVILPDGSVQVTSLCGQKIITKEQAFADADDLKALILEAAREDFDYYKVIYDLCIKYRADKLGISVKDLTDELDEKTPENKDVTFRELHHLPKPTRLSDFMPRVVHLGYPTEIPDGILGVTWTNTGVIYYNPEARMLDYITGRPKVMAHEMVHGNINFQKFPMDEAFDVEMNASIPEGLWAQNQVDLPSHGYFETLREIDEIYFNFDFKQMEKDVFTFDFAGNVVYNEANYKYYYDQLQTIKKENLDFFQNVVIPEFYSDPVWWGAVNHIRGDNDSVFRMVMALHYNPTLLGGSQKTMEWLSAHEDEIKDIAKEAFDAGVGQGQGGGMDMYKFASPTMIQLYHKMYSEKERATIEAYFRAHPAELAKLRKMSPTEALAYVGKIKSTGVTVQ